MWLVPGIWRHFAGTRLRSVADRLVNCLIDPVTSREAPVCLAQVWLECDVIVWDLYSSYAALAVLPPPLPSQTKQILIAKMRLLWSCNNVTISVAWRQDFRETCCRLAVFKVKEPTLFVWCLDKCECDVTVSVSTCPKYHGCRCTWTDQMMQHPRDQINLPAPRWRHVETHLAGLCDARGSKRSSRDLLPTSELWRVLSWTWLFAVCRSEQLITWCTRASMLISLVQKINLKNPCVQTIGSL